MTSDIDKARNALLRALDGLPLDGLLFALNAACRKWRAGTLKTSVPALQELEQGNPVLFWMAAETARHALWHCAAREHDSPLHLPKAETLAKSETVDFLLRLCSDVQLNVPVGPEWERTLDDTIWGAVGQIWLRQYSVEKQSFWRVGQAWLLYHDAPERLHRRDPNFPIQAFRDAVRSSLGTSLESFLFVIFQINAKAWSDQPALALSTLAPFKDRRYDALLGELRANGLMELVYPAVFRALSATPEEMLKWGHAQLGRSASNADDFQARCDAPNALARYPLVRCHPDKPDHCIAPVPHLILEWLNEPLMDLVARQGTAGIDHFTLASVFEEYVGLVADLCSPRGPGWVHESELKPAGQKRKVVDWAREFGEHVVLLEAKRAYVQPAARGRWNVRDWNSAKKSLIDGVTQACDFWTSVQRDRVPKLQGAKQKQPVALIVMHGDSAFYAASEEWRREVDTAISALPDRIPWTVMSIDTYEAVSSAWHREDESWFPSILERAARTPSQRPFADIEMRARGPMWDAEMAFLDAQAKRVDPAFSIHDDPIQPEAE